MRRLRVLALVLALLSMSALLAAGCGSSKKGASSTSTTDSTTGTVPTTITPVVLQLPSSAERFAAYSLVPLLASDAPAYAGPATPTSLDGVKIVPELRKVLANADVSKALTKNGFVVVPADLRLFQYAYEGNIYSGWPVFVTTDVAYHEWHLVFDKLLRTLEQKVLLPKLERLVTGLSQAAHKQSGELAGGALKDTAARVDQLFQVAQAELALPVELEPLAKKEKALIDAHSASEVSPITGKKTDYSLFTPRGHYTRNAALTRFFVSMSVLGQLDFCLPDTFECPGLEPARIGILASRVLTENADLVSLWREIYEPTAFLVGLADDYTPLEVAAAAERSTPQGLTDAKAFASDATVSKVIQALVKERPVLINPEKASIRLMGTRFVIDSFLLDQLVYPNVGTEEKPRLLPSALDLAASFGSDFAYKQLERTGATAYANYDSQLKQVRKLVAERPAEAWGSTVYDAWLSALEPMFALHGQAFPDFMRTQAWTAKAHQAGFGSYTELKHDTILYAKQIVAEGGGDIPPLRRNWVEPDPIAFARLAAVAELTRQGLRERKLLTPELAGLLRDDIGLFRFFERIASDELAGKPISKRDNEQLTYIGSTFETMWLRTGTELASGAAEPDKDAAVVADIASSPKSVLELGTGRIDRIFVLVPDDSGAFQVAVGGVYSYYEFANPPGERLTDEAWRALIDKGNAPKRPEWEQAFIAGSIDDSSGLSTSDD